MFFFNRKFKNRSETEYFYYGLSFVESQKICFIIICLIFHFAQKLFYFNLKGHITKKKVSYLHPRKLLNYLIY